ncbi:unnamed protein product [Adineta steineri]|uniref:RING-type domain-containing protein n=1 Tax=Adineta steineri TaxID=433720 RepID=A0A814USV6_9BILA|nr:unnamed protein product [Adineta steineri]
MYFVSDTSKFRVGGLMAYSDVEIRPSHRPFGAMDCIDFISTTEDIEPYYSQSNSNSSDQENDVIISSSASTISVNNNSTEENIFDEEDNFEYYMQFSWPADSDNEFEYYYDDNNDDLYINNHLNRKQINSIDILEDNKFQRTKRSNKKISARCQIKTKYAKSIKYKSHNEQLYMHHRLYKQVRLDPPSRHYMPSSSTIPSYTPEVLRTFTINNNDNRDKPSVNRTTTTNTVNQLQAYTINAHNIPNEPAFDDAMINFLLDMQNRDLSPNDYEMLLRLDERVQRKTVNKNVLDKFPTVTVNDTHLNEQCTICLETYNLGQQLKLLPCSHMFHVNCIETYLKEFSTQCPLDNLSLI